MTKLRLSKKGFYLFNISLLIVEVVITGVGVANLLSGQVLSPHAMFQTMGGYNHFLLRSHPCLSLAVT